MTTDDLLSAQRLRKVFKSAGRVVTAVDDVSFSLRSGETLAIVGESGSGKSTLARCVLHLVKPDSGSVSFRGRRLEDLSRSEMRSMRSKMQLVFQDPFSSLNPTMRIEELVGEPIRAHERSARDVDRRVAGLLESVSLEPTAFMKKYPRQLSGGERQRVVIARALALSPEVLFCDEAVSALDVSTQASIIELLLELQKARGLSMVFITHDVGVVQLVADRIAVMYLGKVVEFGEARDVLRSPQHEYTRKLLDAVPRLRPAEP